MGHGKQQRPERLAEKVGRIRAKLGLSQTGMAAALEQHGVKVRASSVALYELGRNLPGLLTLRAYAKLARISMDVIVDDELDLPAKLPAKPNK